MDITVYQPSNTSNLLESVNKFVCYGTYPNKKKCF